MIQETSENKAKTCQGFLGQNKRIFYKKLRIGASTESFLKLSDFSTQGFFTSVLRFHNILHVHYLFPPERSKTKLFEALPVLDFIRIPFKKYDTGKM